MAHKTEFVWVTKHQFVVWRYEEYAIIGVDPFWKDGKAIWIRKGLGSRPVCAMIEELTTIEGYRLMGVEE